MPLTHVSMLAGKPPAYRRAILDGLYEAMRETFGVPEDDRFMAITRWIGIISSSGGPIWASNEATIC